MSIKNNYIVPKVLWPEFQIDNSWIICEKQEEHTYYHLFCSNCGLYHIKTLGYFQSKVLNKPKMICINCNNDDFIYDIGNYSQTLNIKSYFKKNQKAFVVIYYINKPFLKDNNELNYKHILFKFKHHFSCTVEDRDAYIDYGFLEYLYQKNIQKKFMQDIYNVVRNELHFLYKLPKKLNEYKILFDHSMIIFNIINKKKRLPDFRFHLVNASKLFSTFDEYIKYSSNYTSAKSIKREFYKNSTYKVNSDFFDMAYVICHSFTDVNIVIYLLRNIHLLNKNMSISMSSEGKEKIVQIIKILLKSFSEVNLKKILFEKYFDDVFWMILSIGLNYNYDFRKIKCNINSIHSKLIEIKNEEEIKLNGNKIFSYSFDQLKKETLIKELHFKLPKDLLTLSEWSSTLYNCLFSYADKILNNNLTIYGVFKNDNLLCAISINNTEILEVRGKYNKPVNNADLIIINEWFKKYNITF